MKVCVSFVLCGVRHGGGQTRAEGHPVRPGADGGGRGEDWHVPPAVPPGATHLGQGGRGQQLRQGPLLGGQGDLRPRARQDPQAVRHLRESPRIPHLQVIHPLNCPNNFLMHKLNTPV